MADPLEEHGSQDTLEMEQSATCQTECSSGNCMVYGSPLNSCLRRGFSLSKRLASMNVWMLINLGLVEAKKCGVTVYWLVQRDVSILAIWQFDGTENLVQA